MHEKHVIEVTADDIAKGERDQGLRCPVARAMNRATHRPWCVDTDFAWPLGNIEVTVAMPPLVAARITAFDDGKGMEPFVFELEW